MLNFKNISGFYLMLFLTTFLVVEAQVRPTCTSLGAGPSISPRDCKSALASFSQKGRFISDNRPSNRKSCGSCQVALETVSGGNLLATYVFADSAIDNIFKQCPHQAGSVMLPPIADRPRDPMVRLTLSRGSGQYSCR